MILIDLFIANKIKRGIYEYIKPLISLNGICSINANFMPRFLAPLWYFIVFPIISYIYKPEKIIAPANVGPFFVPKNSTLIVVVHDLHFLELVKNNQGVAQKLMVLCNRLLFRMNIKTAKVFVFVSETQRIKFITKLRTLGIDTAADLELIPNSFDLEEFNGFPKWRECSLPQIVIATGKNYNKNIILIRSFIEHLVKTSQHDSIGHNFELVMLNCYLEDLARQDIVAEYERKFQKKLLCYSSLSRHDYLQTLSVAQLLVVPSVEEGFGRVLIEASALGVPILASDIDVFNEVLGPNRTMFNPMCFLDFADSLLEALNESVKSTSVDLDKYSRPLFLASWEDLFSETHINHFNPPY